MTNEELIADLAQSIKTLNSLVKECHKQRIDIELSLHYPGYNITLESATKTESYL